MTMIDNNDIYPSKEKYKEKNIVKVVVYNLLMKFSFDYIFSNLKRISLGIDKYSESIFSIIFKPDIDIIAININKKIIIGIEIKGYRKKEYTFNYLTGAKNIMLDRANIYEALGEALMYLKNPYKFRYKGKYIKGSILDKVYLCYPHKSDFVDFEEVVALTPIGLMSVYDAESLTIVREAKQNPLMSQKAKDIFLDELYLIKNRCKYYDRSLII